MQDARPASIDVKRRVLFSRLQLVGIPLLILLPALAIAGVFGPGQGQRELSSETVEVKVEYPTRLRYKAVSTLDITLGNPGSEALGPVQVHVDRSYRDKFSNVSFSPSVTRITGDAYMVELDAIPPGSERAVDIMVQGEAYGWHEGRVWVVLEDAITSEIAVATWMFP